MQWKVVVKNETYKEHHSECKTYVITETNIIKKTIHIWKYTNGEQKMLCHHRIDSIKKAKQICEQDCYNNS